jgi:tetratricopeptide (TPR) repeat protein
LAALHAEHKDKNVKAVGVFLEPHQLVEAYVREHQVTFSHPVGSDDNGMTALSYPAAAASPGVPYAFVIDLQGRLAWHGPPANGLGNVVQAMLSGDYSVEVGRQVLDIEAHLGGALMAERWDTAVTMLDRLIKLDPNPFRYQMLKFEVLSGGKKDAAAAKACAPALLAGMTDATDLDDFARYLMSGELGQDYFDLALTFCEAAYKTSLGKRKDIAHSYARAKYLNGDLAGAIELEERAIELAAGEGDILFRVTLEKYENAAREKH